MSGPLTERGVISGENCIPEIEVEDDLRDALYTDRQKKLKDLTNKMVNMAKNSPIDGSAGTALINEDMSDDEGE